MREVIPRNKIYLFYVCGHVCRFMCLFDCFNLRLKLQPLNLWFGMSPLSISSWFFHLTLKGINFNTNETSECVCVNNYSNAKKKTDMEINVTCICWTSAWPSSCARRGSKLRNHPLLPFPYLIPEPFCYSPGDFESSYKVSGSQPLPTYSPASELLYRFLMDLSKKWTQRE